MNSLITIFPPINAPLPPTPQQLTDGLPDETKKVEISRSDDRLNLWADSDNSSKNTWVSDVPGQPCAVSPSGLETYWPGAPRIEYNLILRHYLRQVDKSYQTVPYGQTHSVSATYKHGISTEDSSTLSFEMGVTSGDTGGLESKISSAFSHSVTVTDESEGTISDTYSGPDTKGYTNLFVAWQHVIELVALDKDGNELQSYAGKGDVAWDGYGHYSSGADLYYKTVKQVFPQDQIFRCSHTYDQNGNLVS